MPQFPANPLAPKEFLEKWLPEAFAASTQPPGTEDVDVKLGVKLDGDPVRLVIDDAAPVPTDPLEEKVVKALAAAPLTRTALRERLGVRNETLGVAIERLIAAGRVLRVDGGLAVPVPPSGDRRERNGP